MTDEFRAKAAQARRLAKSMHGGDPAIARLLELAEHFDALAEQAERGIVPPSEAVQQPAQQQQQPQPKDDESETP